VELGHLDMLWADAMNVGIAEKTAEDSIDQAIRTATPDSYFAFDHLYLKYENKVLWELYHGAQ
jgi:hypothetical protein